MDYISHTVGGTLAVGAGLYLLNKYQIDLFNPLYLTGGAVVGALLPDIDHPQSYLGRKIRFLSNILYSTIGHRTFTHSFLFTFILGIIVSFFNYSLSTGLVIGILSHILLDMLTARGVSIFYPFNKKRYKLFNIH